MTNTHEIINGIIETIEEINETDKNLIKTFNYFILIDKKNATQELFELISNSLTSSHLNLNLMSFDKNKLFLILQSSNSSVLNTYHIYYNHICYYDDDEYINDDDYNEYRIEIKKIV